MPGFKKEVYKDNAFPFAKEILMNMTNIIQGKGIIDGKECSNVLPFVTTFYEPAYDESDKLIIKSDYRFKLKPYSGFLSVQYETNGKYPKYDEDTPFEIECYKYENGKYALTSIKDLNFEWDCTSLLKRSEKDSLDPNKQRFTPKEHYDSYSYTQAVWVKIKKDNNYLAIVHIPIYFYLNKYSNAAINEWDGNGIEINKDKGIILSPQVGAGYKEINNSFTGVIIGTKETHTTEEDSTRETGLFGYNHGEQTIFLDAQTGKSEFGLRGKGQIIIDPGNVTDENNTPQATITGGSYTGPSAAEKGEPDTAENPQGSGLCINLTRPSIDFGSGNFNVSPEGHITAKGGGTIAGWKINNYKIFKDKTGMSSVDEIQRNENKEISNGAMTQTFPGLDSKTGKITSNEQAVAFWAGTDKFFVTHEGVLRTKEAIIGNGKWTAGTGGALESDNTIHIGSSNDNSAIYSGKTSFKDGIHNGFYLGADGLSIGKTIVGGQPKKQSAFEVSKDGDVCFRSGKIGFDEGNPTFNPDGESHNYWTIDGKAIKYMEKTGYNTDDEGIYIGTDGIGLGERKFYVDKDGAVTGADMTVVNGGFKIVKRNYNKDGSYVDEEPSFSATIEEGKSLVIANNIRATGGTVGGWYITSEKISANGLTLWDTGTINANYEEGSSGWQITSTGSAAFNNLSVGGTKMTCDNGGAINCTEINITGGSISVGDTTIDSTGIDIPSGKTGFKVGGTTVPIAASNDNGNTFLELDYLKAKSLVCDAGQNGGYTKIGPGYLKMGLSAAHPVHCELKGVIVPDPDSMYVLIDGQRYDVIVGTKNVYNVVRQIEEPTTQ